MSSPKTVRRNMKTTSQNLSLKGHLVSSRRVEGLRWQRGPQLRGPLGPGPRRHLDRRGNQRYPESLLRLGKFCIRPVSSRAPHYQVSEHNRKGQTRRYREQGSGQHVPSDQGQVGLDAQSYRDDQYIRSARHPGPLH